MSQHTYKRGFEDGTVQNKLDEEDVHGVIAARHYHRLLVNTYMNDFIDTEFINQLLGLSSYQILMIVILVGLLSFSKEIGQRIAKAKIYCPKRAVGLRKLKSHPFFQDLVTWREVTIKNMNYDCELRRKLFTDMLDIKLKCLYNEIKTISKAIVLVHLRRLQSNMVLFNRVRLLEQSMKRRYIW